MGLRWGELLESDYIPEAYVFARPPSLEESVTDVLGLRSKPWQKSEPDSRDYYYIIIWKSTLAVYFTHSSTFVRTLIGVMYYPNNPNQVSTLKRLKQQQDVLPLVGE